VKMAQEQGLRWQKLLQYEHERRLYLEDMVEQLGKQHSNLEKQIRKSMNGQVAADTAGMLCHCQQPNPNPNPSQ